MNLGELCQEVYTITGREDLVAETQLAIRRATLKFHAIDFWLRDKFEQILQFTSASVLQIDIAQSLPRFRKFEHIYPYDVTCGKVVPIYDQISGQARGLKEISAAQLFDAYNGDKLDVFYMAGNFVNIRFSQGREGIYLSYWQYPVVTLNGYVSWIADMYPYILIEEAAGHILTAIGQVEDAVRFIDPQRGSVYNPLNGHLMVLRTNEIEATGR